MTAFPMFVPKDQVPVIRILLNADLVAEKGSVLAIGMDLSITAMTPEQFDMRWRPGGSDITTEFAATPVGPAPRKYKRPSRKGERKLRPIESVCRTFSGRVFYGLRAIGVPVLTDTLAPYVVINGRDNRSSVGPALADLRSLGLIESVGKIGKRNFWQPTEKGCKVFDDYGATRCFVDKGLPVPPDHFEKVELVKLARHWNHYYHSE